MQTFLATLAGWFAWFTDTPDAGTLDPAIVFWLSCLLMLLSLAVLIAALLWPLGDEATQPPPRAIVDSRYTAGTNDACAWPEPLYLADPAPIPPHGPVMCICHEHRPVCDCGETRP